MPRRKTKPTVRFNLIVPSALMERARQQAELEDLSVAHIMVRALRQALASAPVRPRAPRHDPHGEEEVHDLPERPAAPQPGFIPRDEAAAFIGG